MVRREFQHCGEQFVEKGTESVPGRCTSSTWTNSSLLFWFVVCSSLFLIFGAQLWILFCWHYELCQLTHCWKYYNTQRCLLAAWSLWILRCSNSRCCASWSAASTPSAWAIRRSLSCSRRSLLFACGGLLLRRFILMRCCHWDVAFWRFLPFYTPVG